MSAKMPDKSNMKIAAAPTVGHPCRGCYFYQILDCTSAGAQDYLNSLFEGGCRGKIAKLKTETDDMEKEVVIFSAGSY